MSYVYVIYRPSGEPCYVGKGNGARLRSHCHKTHNKHLASIIAKSSVELPARKIADDLSESEAFELEEFLISIIGRKANGGQLVNQSDGGVGGPNGRRMSQEERDSRSASLAKPDTRERMRLSHLGKPSTRRGTKASPETRERLRLSHLGKKQSPELIEKRAAANRGKKRTAEYSARVSVIRTGETRSMEARQNMSNGRRGMILSDQHKKNISAGLKRFHG